MSRFTDARPAAARPPGGPAQGLLRWLCTSNPFYVLSAGLFLAGLWASFEAQNGDVQTWALMSGLTAYTLLLAVTACLLVRFGGVWDDVRTVLLLVVLLFLATSVTFDDVLVADAGRGLACYLGGLLVAVVVSEGLLWGARLKLPALFRIPYYLILGLFFLYPLFISPLLGEPQSEKLMWAVFGFSPTAGLVVLTLLPAIRRGENYVRNNGSPWQWPLYPWVLFGLLGFAVPARAILLCWSMHLIAGRDIDRLIFGPYFLVPFGFAVAVLLLEIAIVSQRRGVRQTALAFPVWLVVLAMVGHRSDPIYEGFLEKFTARLGGDPLFLTLLASAGFYAYAALRRVPSAVEALTAALVVLAFVRPNSFTKGAQAAPWSLPILTAATLQLGLGLWRRNAWRCLIGGGGLAAGAALALPAEAPLLRCIVAFHLVMLVVLLVGAAFDNDLGRRLRVVGGGMVMLGCVAAVFGWFGQPASVPAWTLSVYPVMLAALLAGYGLLLTHWPSHLLAGLALSPWLATGAWRVYAILRREVVGLDYITLSMALFAVAVLISLAKSGLLLLWIEALAKKGFLGGFGAAEMMGMDEEAPPLPAAALWCSADRTECSAAIASGNPAGVICSPDR